MSYFQPTLGEKGQLVREGSNAQSSIFVFWEIG
jgi:hypothetical protein